MSLEKFKQVIKNNNNLIFGTDETIKMIKQGKVHTIFISKDCKSSTKDKIFRYKKSGELEIYELDITSADIGALCKKQFWISVISC